MKVEYKKDLRHNYMIITVEDQNTLEPYCVKLLEHQEIAGVLPVEQRLMDNKCLFYYDITGKQSMNNLLEKAALTYDKVKQLFTILLQTLERAYDYLLPEDDFILSPEHIYLDVVTYCPSLCFLSGYHKNSKEQMVTLMEYLMNKVDYNDKEAVLLVYQLYAVSREEGFTYGHLKEAIENKNLMADMGKPSRSRHSKESAGNALISKEQEYKPEIYEHLNMNKQIVREPDKHQNIKKQIVRESDKHQNTNKQIVRDPDMNQNVNKKIVILPDKYHNIKKQIVKLPDKHQNLDNQIVWEPDNYLNTNKQIVKEPQENKSFANKIYNGINGILPHKGLPDQQAAHNQIPVMMERVEGEKEVAFYPISTYLYSGACLAGGIFLFIISFTTKLIYNAFGNRIDYSKLFALILILLCVEGYLLKRILDKKNKITKMVKVQEYIDPRQNDLPYCQPIMRNESFSEALERSEPGAQVARIDQASVERQLEEDNNPTCLLNGDLEQRERLLLEAVDKGHHQDIPLDVFPFFIGKLKKNVDYCLEKEVISRYHAKITKEEEQYYLTDLNSTNGTYVNKEALQTYEKKEIHPGDEIGFANIRYIFRAIL